MPVEERAVPTRDLFSGHLSWVQWMTGPGYLTVKNWVTVQLDGKVSIVVSSREKDKLDKSFI